MTINLKNLGAGILFLAIGLFFSIESLLHLRIGSALNMGPGFFPLVLGTLLVVLGAAIGITGLGTRPEAIGRISWRGTVLVIGAILFFALCVRGLGFTPALAGAMLIAASASGKMKMPGVLALSAAVSTFGTLVFVVALRLPYPIIGRWITG